MTNTEFITDLMEFVHPMMQMYVIHCIESMSKDTIENEQEIRESWNNGFIDVDTWIDMAKIADKRLKEKYH